MRITERESSREPQLPLAATVDSAGWGVFLIWVGLALYGRLGWAVFFLGTGGLLLVGQAVRRSVGSNVDWFAVVLGIFLVVVGGSRALELQLDDAVVPSWFVPSMFVAAGIAVVATAWKRHRRG